MVSIKAGVEHLRDQFTSLPDDEFEVEHGPVREEALPDIIRSSGDILVDVDTQTKDSELEMHLMVQDSKLVELKQSASRISNRRPMSHGATEGRPFNQRISLPSAKEVSAFDHDSDGETGLGDMGADEEISRDGVKQASRNIIAIEERRQLRSRNPDEG